MASTVERVTVTLPQDLIRDIDRQEKNRSKFVLDAVRNELDRREREELRRSLRNPHPDTAELEPLGLQEWALSLPDEDTKALVDPRAGTDVQWIPGEGWTERKGGRRN